MSTFRTVPAFNMPIPLNRRERMVGLLTAVSEELQDVPLHYTLSDLAGTLHCSCPSMDQFKVRVCACVCAVR